MSNALVLATQEACNNACQHGADGAGCDVSVSYLNGTITIEVADRGGGFDFEAVKATWPPCLLEGSGRGLFMVAELADQIEVVHRRQGTLVRIFKPSSRPVGRCPPPPGRLPHRDPLHKRRWCRRLPAQTRTAG